MVIGSRDALTFDKICGEFKSAKPIPEGHISEPHCLFEGRYVVHPGYQLGEEIQNSLDWRGHFGIFSQPYAMD